MFEPNHDRLSSRTLIERIDELLEPTVPVYCDIGNTMCHAIRHLRRRGPGSWHLSLVLGGMGNAVPQAMGACFGRREPTVALVGDGALLMCVGELRTAVEHRLPVVVVAFNNEGWGMVEQGRRLDFADAGLPSMLFRSKPSLATLAAGVGVHAEVVRDVAHFESALGSALRRPEPTVLEVLVDPHEPAPFESRRHTLSAGA